MVVATGRKPATNVVMQTCGFFAARSKASLGAIFRVEACVNV